MAAGLVAMGVAACNVHHANKATFRIVLDEEAIPIAVRALPSPQGHGDNAGSSTGSNSNSGPSSGGGSGGGGSGGGGVPAGSPGAGLTVVTEGRFSLASLAGDAAGTTFRRLNGLAIGSDGTVYAADPGTHSVRAVPPGGGPVRTVAGLPDGLPGFLGDNLPAAGSRLAEPVGLALNARTGALVVADAGNRRIREFVPGGRIYTHAGGGPDPAADVAAATVAQLGRPTGMALDAAGEIFFTERDTGRVRRVDATGALKTLATLTPGQVGPIAANSAGTQVWVGDGGTLQLIRPGPAVVVAVVTTGPGTITGLAADQVGTLYLGREGPAPRSAVIQRLALDAGGMLASGRQPETVGGTGADLGASAAAFVAAPNPDARTQLIAGGGECTLAIDLANASDPTLLAGTLYAGNGLQVLMLAPVGP